MIDFESIDSHVFCNARTPLQERQRITQLLLALQPHKGYLWFATSGSTAKWGQQRWVALSRAALLASAKAVNAHLGSDAKDRWVVPLPPFHVGGIGVWARAYLSGATVYDVYAPTWIPKDYCIQLAHWRATLTALVPTHVYDLVQQRLAPPASLRAAVVGGGRLTSTLYRAAIALGWPLLPSYGMTECASQIATASLDSWRHGHAMPPLQLLPHITAQVNSEGRLQLRSPALLSTYALITATGPPILQDPYTNGWFTSDDRVILTANHLQVLGRTADWVKVGGESVDIASLQDRWESCCQAIGLTADTALFACPDKRLGHVVALAATPQAMSRVPRLQEFYQQQVMPYEQIRAIYTVPVIPRTALNKVAQQLLLDALNVPVV